MTEWILLLRALSDANVRFLVVGGVATIVHGYVRATNDLDLWIEATHENVRRLGGVLSALGIGGTFVLDELLDPYAFVRIGSPTGRRLDLMSHAEGLMFAPAWRDRYEMELDGLIVPVIGLRDLLKTKEAVGRHKDLDDAESLRALHHLPK